MPRGRRRMPRSSGHGKRETPAERAIGARAGALCNELNQLAVELQSLCREQRWGRAAARKSRAIEAARLLEELIQFAVKPLSSLTPLESYRIAIAGADELVRRESATKKEANQIVEKALRRSRGRQDVL